MIDLWLSGWGWLPSPLQKSSGFKSKSKPPGVGSFSIFFSHRSFQKPDPFLQGFWWFSRKQDPWVKNGIGSSPRLPLGHREIESVTDYRGVGLSRIQCNRNFDASEAARASALNQLPFKTTTASTRNMRWVPASSRIVGVHRSPRGVTLPRNQCDNI